MSNTAAWAQVNLGWGGGVKNAIDPYKKQVRSCLYPEAEAKLFPPVILGVTLTRLIRKKLLTERSLDEFKEDTTRTEHR